MGKNYFVSDLEPGLILVDYFAVRKKDLIEYEDKTRLELELGDKTGRISGVLWHNAESIYKLFNVEDIIKVKGKVTTYADKLQISVKRIRKANPEEFDPTDFLPKTEKNIRKMVEQLEKHIASIDESSLKKLLNTIFSKDFLSRFSQSPAGKLWHHRYIGGLIEHTLTVCNICEKIAPLYPFIDKDLLLTGALLHDIGKVDELKSITYFDYTDKGRLVGHIILSDEMTRLAINTIPDFPENLAMKVRHLILSHHGEKEMGSPVLPQTPEAFILHFADKMDSTMGALSRINEQQHKNGKDWSNFIKLLNRFIYFG